MLLQWLNSVLKLKFFWLLPADSYPSCLFTQTVIGGEVSSDMLPCSPLHQRVFATSDTLSLHKYVCAARCHRLKVLSLRYLPCHNSGFQCFLFYRRYTRHVEVIIIRPFKWLILPAVPSGIPCFHSFFFFFSNVGPFCFYVWKANGVGWKIAEEWFGITASAVPCQPQGRIPEIRNPHRGTSVLYWRQYIFELSQLL